LICKYAFTTIHDTLFLCKNSVIEYNNSIIPIETSEKNNCFYKLTINGVEISGQRYRPDLLKCDK
jgi:hypothetical protein